MQITAYQKLIDISQNCIIAVDGEAASGKGTIGKKLATKYKLSYCQSSIFYRRLAYEAISLNIQDDIEKIIHLSKDLFLDHTKMHDSPVLYNEDVTRTTSIIAENPLIRKNLLNIQVEFIQSRNRIVMDGRDIGTVIAPNADIKLYITADVKIRAKRRCEQLQKSGKTAVLEDVLNRLSERDNRDITREHAPLTKADDAIFIDTSSISIEDILSNIEAEIKKLS